MAGLYFHIPFCKSKCHYCNFYSVASRRHIDGFSKVLMREMTLQKDYLGGEELATIYFGGGTPSLLSAEELGGLIRHAKKIFHNSEPMEITVEANPEHITEDYLQGLHTAGVNRISVGLQSLSDAPLKALGRTHDAACSIKALDTLRNGPIHEISVDLIYGVPSLSDDLVLQQIQTLIAMGIPHISAYALTVEEHTAMHKMIARGTLPPVSEEQCATQYLLLIDVLEKAGYEHYEISNFCLPGHHSRHNSAYWDGTPYLGVGPSAHSFNGNSRQWNVSSISEYTSAIANGELRYEKEILSPTQCFNEMVMTGIRTSAGLSLADVEYRFGINWTSTLRAALPALLSKGWVENDPLFIRLTTSGKLHADGIASDLFRVDEGE